MPFVGVESHIDPTNYDSTYGRRQPWVTIRRLVWTCILGPLHRMIAPTTTLGGHHVRNLTGPVVVVSNHRSHVDSAVIVASLPAEVRQRLVIAAAADYFYTSAIRARLVTTLLGTIPVERDRATRQSLARAEEIIADGWSLLVFPEGGRTTGDAMRSFKPGAAWIASRTGVQVVPVFVDHTELVLPKGASLPRRHRVTVRFGVALTAGPYESTRAFGRRVEAAVASLGGPRDADAAQRVQQATVPPTRHATTATVSR